MTGRLVRGRNESGEQTLAADVVICGGGAGGCMAARELAREGLSVIVLEQGPDHRLVDFNQREDDMIPTLFAEQGGQRTDDLSVLVMSGRGLGGSTTHNQNLCKRIPDEVLLRWGELGVDGVSPEEMAPLFAEVERDLGVTRITDEQVNEHNHVVRRGVEALGWRGGRLSHNRDERCVGSGFCELGCTFNAKLHARRVLVPEAVEAGAVFFTDTRVDRVRHDGRVASGVDASFLDADAAVGGSLRVNADVVCLAGSAIGTATLAWASELPDPHDRLGRGLRLHPGALVAGVFEQRIEAWKGIPQSEDCTEHLDFGAGSDRRVWIVPSFAHPVGSASLMRSSGPDLMRRMRDYAHMGAVAAMVHDETEGRVTLDGSRRRIHYEPDAADREQLALGCREGARLLLAAGALECVVPAVPDITIRGEGDLDAIRADRFAPHDARLTAVHPMGTAAMSREPEQGVTDARGRHHQVQGLYVVDGSLFPTSVGVPPQLGIYTFAMKVARGIAR